jgi:hypothetical protein
MMVVYCDLDLMGSSTFSSVITGGAAIYKIFDVGPLPTALGQLSPMISLVVQNLTTHI